MVCFIILHYLSISETNTCIASLKKYLKNQFKIVVVDNASPNNSGKELLEQYYDDETVDVILNPENAGYARGNNIGYLYAKKKYNPNFIIVMNNDVEIEDQFFITKIASIYEEEHFDVLGPDIYSTSFLAHQSPKRISHFTLEEVKNLNKQYKIALASPVKLRIKCFFKRSFYLRKKKYQASRLKIDFKKKYYNVPLHGACVIFSKQFIDKFDYAFFPGTFFYFEMEILDYLCMKNNLKVVYNPSIQVLHHQNVSTNVAYNNIYDKTIFSYKSNIKSSEAFIDLVEGDCNGESSKDGKSDIT